MTVMSVEVHWSLNDCKSKARLAPGTRTHRAAQCSHTGPVSTPGTRSVPQCCGGSRTSRVRPAPPGWWGPAGDRSTSLPCAGCVRTPGSSSGWTPRLRSPRCRSDRRRPSRGPSSATELSSQGDHGKMKYFSMSKTDVEKSGRIYTKP